MKKVIGLGLLLVACHGSMTKQAPAPGIPGAASPREAVGAFLDAAKAGDLQAMSAVWGTPDGLARETVPQTELEQREVYIRTCLRHDKYTVLSEASAADGRRILLVQLVRGPLTRQADFVAAQDKKSGRWYFQQTDLNKLTDICMAK